MSDRTVSQPVPQESPERPGPYAALAAKARATSDGALAAAVAAGALWLALVLVLRPGWWQFAIAPAAVAAFGTWGIADRELATAPAGSPSRALRATRFLAAAAGTIAVAITAFRIVGAVVGRVIS